MLVVLDRVSIGANLTGLWIGIRWVDSFLHEVFATLYELPVRGILSVLLQTYFGTAAFALGSHHILLMLV